MFYSPSKRGFFDEAIHGDAIPEDAVEITRERYAELMAAQLEGKMIAANDNGEPIAVDQPPPPAPSVVTMRQARLALLGAGLLQQVNDAVSAMPGAEGDAARIEWEYAATVERNSQLVAAMAGALSLDDAALDDLFTTAATL